MKRFLDCNFSDMEAMNKKELLESLEASEGRVLIAECTLCYDSLLPPLTNAEISAAFGADLLLLNMFDINHPHIDGILGVADQDVIHELKRMTGRLIGVNLEPVDTKEQTMGAIGKICEGRQASVETALKAKEMGFDFILLTGNPGTGVSNRTITENLKQIKAAAGDHLVLMAGKMHAAGSKKEAGEKIITEETIRDIALMCKMSGTDLHHVGDAGFAPVVPENIMSYSIAIRGKRHTYARMARSINR